MGLMRKFKIIATDVLAALLTVDGSGSKLDSDMLDGKHYYDIINDVKDIFPSVPSKTSDLLNDSGFITENYVNNSIDAAIKNVLNSEV